ncbi:hypothetical protein [Nonomuraea deserti]|uniref:hypothetical protein n=1 Tax=Nonomuraea deserti TaxID=1848322 RepID=UPI0014047C63|nr:hypothetical protein [Nonomuraea deserti]
MAVRHHLGELAHVQLKRRQLGAGDGERLELAVFGGVEVGRVAQEPAGGLPDRGRPR